MNVQLPTPHSRTPRLRRRIGADHGMTLVEATIILAVISALAAMLAPGINGYIDTARAARAREDVETIADAIRSFVADTGELKFLQDGNGTTAGQPPTRADNNRVNLLVSDGDIPALATALSTEAFWTQAINSGDVDTFSNHLIENLPLESSSLRYRNPTDIFVAAPGGNNIDFARSDSAGFNAPHSWRGPYLRSPVDPDPWGNRYAANVAFLDPSPLVALTGITSAFLADASSYPRLDVFVLSAGPDEEIETPSAQDGVVPGDDDVIALVSGNAK